MDAIFDSYITMAHGYLHILQIIFIILLILIYNFTKTSKIKKKIVLIENLQLLLIIFYVVLIFVNIYIVYKLNSSIDYEILPKSIENMRLFFERTNERMFPFWISQLSVTLISLIVYLLLNMKKLKLLKSL